MWSQNYVTFMRSAGRKTQFTSKWAFMQMHQTKLMNSSYTMMARMARKSAPGSKGPNSKSFVICKKEFLWKQILISSTNSWTLVYYRVSYFTSFEKETFSAQTFKNYSSRFFLKRKSLIIFYPTFYLQFSFEILCIFRTVVIQEYTNIFRFRLFSLCNCTYSSLTFYIIHEFCDIHLNIMRLDIVAVIMWKNDSRTDILILLIFAFNLKPNDKYKYLSP